MRILYIHNDYRNPSGEEHSADKLVNLLKRNGHDVQWFRKSSKGIEKNFFKKSLAFFSGIYNPIAVQELKRVIVNFKPEIVQVQNLYPFISPAILKTVKNAGIPIVMRCPNYRLFCPSGLHLDKNGTLCEKCIGPGREIHAVLKNCESNRIKSTGYAIRNYSARKIWKIESKIDMFIVQSDFQKQKFIDNGISSNKITILPGLGPEKINNGDSIVGHYVSFIGRISKEKGIKEFLYAARHLPEIPFMVAGRLEEKEEELMKSSSKNVFWAGYLNGNELELAYENSRIIVVPGKWYEGFPNVIINAMQHKKPVITSKLGAMNSIIHHNENGLLIPPGNVVELVNAIDILYENKFLCKELGVHGYENSKKLYTSNVVYNKLIDIYKSCLENSHL